MFYSGRLTVRDATLLGRMDLISDPLVASPLGVGTNRSVHDITFDNIRVEGFVEGLIVPQRRTTIIEGGRFANVRNVSIGKGQDTIRSMHITEPIVFVPLTPAQIAGRPAYDVSVTQKLAFVDHLHRKVDSLFSPDDLLMTLADGSTLRLYFTDQAAGAVPFPTAAYPQIAGFPASYAAKTNAQLSASYGLWFNGGDLPAGAFTPPRFVGLAVVQPETPPADFNADGDVDGDDFLRMQRGLGMPNASPANGDTDNDGDVDSFDMNMWRSEFGEVGGAVAAASTSTEPAVLTTSAAPRPLTASLVDVAMAHEDLLASLADRRAGKWKRLSRRLA
jgi:hypothetical protein